MKAKKKLIVMKHRIREEKGRKKECVALAVATSIAIILIASFLINSILNQPSTNQIVNSTSEPKAAIVDHLSLTYPNQTFIETATNTLKQAGYSVDYYSGKQVTVEFYRNLPTHKYRIIILRVHSVTHNPQMPYTGLFSSENYTSTKYVYEQLTDQVQKVQYYDGGPTYFAISSKFIQQSMNERFQDSAIIMMGCNGLTYLDMAKAFLEKGAKVYIGWTRSVLASNTDQATVRLLEHLIIEKTAVEQAVYTTLEEVGPDPTEGGLIMYFPLEAGSYTIQNVVDNIVTNTMNIQQKHLPECPLPSET